jgi:phage baseplate assembly protein gpV
LTGSYRATSVIHSYGAGIPFTTRIVCGGKDSAAFADLLRPASTGASSGAAGPGAGAPAMMIGQVTNIDDPEGLCRVKVKFPTLTDQDESAWARVVAPGAGDQRGLQWIPQLNDEVLVGFELGDTARPLVLGGVWSRTDQPPQPSAVSGGAIRSYVLATKANHRLTFTDEDPGAILVELGDGSGSIRLDPQGMVFTTGAKVSVSGRDIELVADNQLTLKANRVLIEGAGDVTVSGGLIKLN